MKKLSFILTCALFLGSLFSLGATKSFFTDTEKSAGNILSVATTFTTPTPTSTIEPTPTVTPTPTATPTPITNHLVINEVYYDVKSPNKGVEPANEWIEIYNPTNEAINISGWKIEENQGLSHQRTIPTSPPIPARGYAVITPDSSTWSYWPEIPLATIKIVLGNSIGNGLANENDRVILKNPAGVEIDAISYGNDTYAFSPACPDVVTGHSLERNPAGKDTNTAADFVDRSIPTPGT